MDTLTYRKITKAAKRHRCNLCLEFIQSGEVYMLSSIADSGTVNSFKEHTTCAELADILNGAFEIDYGLFYELVMEDAERLKLGPGNFLEQLNKLKQYYNVR